MTKKLYGNDRISIHALREEGDAGAAAVAASLAYFYPRPPRGGRRCRFWGRKGQM